MLLRKERCSYEKSVLAISRHRIEMIARYQTNIHFLSYSIKEIR